MTIKKNESAEKVPEKSSFLEDIMVLSINLAIVGGGRACKYFLELLKNEPFPYLNINIVGVCDINPAAEGLVMAREMGIYTTDSFQNLFKIDNLDSIIELTGRRDVLLEIIRLRPKRVGVLEHNIGRLCRNLFEINKRLKSVEQKLVLEKMSSDFLIQQSTAKIAVLNTDFTIAEANEAYIQAVGKPRGQVIGAFCYQVSHDLKVPCSSSLPGMNCPMVETLRSGISSHVIHEHRNSAGGPTYCNIVTYPLKDQDGEIFKVIEIWRDITEEFSTRWEKRVSELKSDLQKLVQEDRIISLGKLAASCAHEINNPIQGLLTFSHYMQEILAQGEPSLEDLKQFKSHLALMCRELERCGNIVSGLLSFARESPKEYKGIDLNGVLEAVIALTSHKMKLRKVDLITRLYPGLLMINGDDHELQQCFLNLIFNAIEAMPGGGKLRIISKLETDKKNIRVEIRDSGYGISKENLEHIFDPFFSTKGEGQGTGLGLSIVYGIVKNHKGSIKLNSTVGKESLFILTFPAL